MEEQKNHPQEGSRENMKEAGDKTCVYGCGCGWSHGHRALLIILGIIILLVVFWVGVKVGEFRTIVRGYNSYGSRGGYSAGYRPMGRTIGGGGYPGQAPAAATGTAPAPTLQQQ